MKEEHTKRFFADKKRQYEAMLVLSPSWIKMAPHAHADPIYIILHSKDAPWCWSVWKRKQKRSNQYSVSISFHLFSLSISIFPCWFYDNNTSFSRCFFWKVAPYFYGFEKLEIHWQHPLCLGGWLRRNALLFATITSGLSLSPPASWISRKAHKQALIKSLNET